MKVVFETAPEKIFKLEERSSCVVYNRNWKL